MIFDANLIASIRLAARTPGEMADLLSVLLANFSISEREQIVAELRLTGLLEGVNELRHSDAGAMRSRPNPSSVPTERQDRLFAQLIGDSEDEGIVELDGQSFALTVLQDMAALDRVIVLTYEGRQLFPAFQFEPRDTEMWLARFSVQRVNQVLRAGKDPWGALGWWLAPNGWIGGSAPADLLGTSDEGEVTQLAEAVLAAAG